MRAEVRALACELPSQRGLPLSRLSSAEVARAAVTAGICEASVARLVAKWPKAPELVLVHLPIHASWLNQAEIYFSIVQRKVLTPNDFADLEAVEERLLAFERHYQEIAQPFQWTFTRSDLARLLERLDRCEPTLSLAA